MSTSFYLGYIFCCWVLKRNRWKNFKNQFEHVAWFRNERFEKTSATDRSGHVPHVQQNNVPQEEKEQTERWPVLPQLLDNR